MAQHKPQARPARAGGKPVDAPADRLADIRAHGREVRKSRASAVAFLQRAGILDKTGKLAEPYRG